MRHRWGTYLIHSTNTGNGWSYCFTNLTIHETAHGEKGEEEDDEGRNDLFFIHKCLV
jgi:hypothetical protein